MMIKPKVDKPFPADDTEREIMAEIEEWMEGLTEDRLREILGAPPRFDDK